MSTIVAIIGRPNVGKSTLFNRLTGKRQALVDDMPGVTRDRRYGDASLGGLPFRIVDTAGLENPKSGDMESRMMQQTGAAIQEAAVILLMIDGLAGVTAQDEYFANMVRKLSKPVILVVNKAESKRSDSGYSEAFSLGLGEPVAISAEHGSGMNDLYDALAPHIATASSEDEQEGAHDAIMQVAIVGRPNVGKSTLLNALLKEDRVLTGPEAGITRDAIAVDFTFEGKPLKLVDTAGLRRKSNIHKKLEKLAVGDSLETIRFAHVVILLLDAEQPLEKQDLALADLIEREGRAIIIGINKWDRVTDDAAWKKALNERLSATLPQIRGVPLIPVSAIRRTGLSRLMRACFSTYETWNCRVPTAALNRWLEKAIAAHPPPMVKGRRLNIKYITQIKARPPSFILSVSRRGKLPDSYLRYLTNSLREAFDLPGVPIRIRLASGKNPYADKP